MYSSRRESGSDQQLPSGGLDGGDEVGVAAQVPALKALLETREKLRELFHTLEEKKRILQLLDRFLEPPAGELAVQVGLGDVHPSMRELSLIGISISLAGGLSAKIAVLGPMRMNYGKAMSAVYHVGQAFGSLPV